MSDELRIRRAIPVDAGALGEVHVRVWRWAYRGQMPDEYLARLRPERRAEIWRADLTEGRIDAWVAETDGAIVAFVGIAAARDADLPHGTVELVMINVLEEHAGKGIGRVLMETVEQHWLESGVDVAVLWVLAGNDRARAAYDHLGWVPDGATGDYEVGGTALPQLRLRKRLV